MKHSDTHEFVMDTTFILAFWGTGGVWGLRGFFAGGLFFPFPERMVDGERYLS